MKTKRVFFCAMSDPIEDPSAFGSLWNTLEAHGIEVEPARSLLEPISAKEKAEEFNRALRSMRYDWIFDLSGGDLANLCLPYIDYEAYACSRTWYAAFSDGTCIVNALAACAHRKAALYPLWKQEEIDGVLRLMEGEALTPSIVSMSDVRFNRHTPVFGGNMRCLMKLLATGRMPDMQGAYLFLESYSARWQQFASLAAQMKQTGLLDGVCGIILGRFNRLEADACSRENALSIMEHYLREQLGRQDVPLFRADGIGHIAGSDGIWISAGKPRLPRFETENPMPKRTLRHGECPEEMEEETSLIGPNEAINEREHPDSHQATLEELFDHAPFALTNRPDDAEEIPAQPADSTQAQWPAIDSMRLFHPAGKPCPIQKEAARPRSEMKTACDAEEEEVMTMPLVQADLPGEPGGIRSEKPYSAPIVSSPEQAARVVSPEEIAMRAARFAKSFNPPQAVSQAAPSAPVPAAVPVQPRPPKAVPAAAQNRPKAARRAAPGRKSRAARKA